MPITCFDYTALQRSFFFPQMGFPENERTSQKYPSLKYLSFNIYLCMAKWKCFILSWSSCTWESDFYL